MTAKKKTPVEKDAPVASAKKSAKKSAKASPKKSAPPEKKEEKNPNKSKPKSDLRKPQQRILECLAKASQPMTRKEIAEHAGVDSAGCTEWIGSTNDDTRLANDTKHFPSLVSLGFVKQSVNAVEGGKATAFYTITAVGRKQVK